MSHFTKVKTKIVELLYLQRALQDMNLEFQEGRVKIRGYLGRKMTVDLKVKTRDGFDIGFVKNAGMWEVVADWEMVKAYSQETFVREVTQRYAYHVVKDQLQVQDYKIVQENRQGGNLTLTLRRG